MQKLCVCAVQPLSRSSNHRHAYGIFRHSSGLRQIQNHVAASLHSSQTFFSVHFRHSFSPRRYSPALLLHHTSSRQGHAPEDRCSPGDRYGAVLAPAQLQLRSFCVPGRVQWRFRCRIRLVPLSQPTSGSFVTFHSLNLFPITRTVASIRSFLMCLLLLGRFNAREHWRVEMEADHAYALQRRTRSGVQREEGPSRLRAAFHFSYQDGFV